MAVYVQYFLAVAYSSKEKIIIEKTTSWKTAFCSALIDSCFRLVFGVRPRGKLYKCSHHPLRTFRRTNSHFAWQIFGLLSWKPREDVPGPVCCQPERLTGSPVVGVWTLSSVSLTVSPFQNSVCCRRNIQQGSPGLLLGAQVRSVKENGKFQQICWVKWMVWTWEYRNMFVEVDRPG